MVLFSLRKHFYQSSQMRSYYSVVIAVASTDGVHIDWYGNYSFSESNNIQR